MFSDQVNFSVKETDQRFQWLPSDKQPPDRHKIELFWNVKLRQTEKHCHRWM